MTLASIQTARVLRVTTVLVMVSREQNRQLLSPTEHRIVTYLAGHAGRFVADWELRDFLYGGVCSPNVVSVHIARIRQKLGRTFIETGELGGYRLSSQRAAELARVCAVCSKPVVQYEDEFICYHCPGTHNVDMGVGRAAYAEDSRSGTQWTQEEEQFAMEHWDDMSLAEIGEKLQRSEASVRGHFPGLRKPYVDSDRRKEKA